MKKLLLSLAVLSGAAFSASAEEVTITIKGADAQFADATVSDLDKKDKPFEFTNSGFTFVTTAGGTNTAYNKAGDLRIYAGGTITVSGAGNMTIQKVVFNISTQGLKRLATITANVGTIAAQTKGDKTVTWTGDANSITYTVGDKANYGSDGEIKAGQLDFDSVVITYTQTGEAKKDADLKFDGIGATVYVGDKTYEGLTLTKATTADVVYSSSDEAVATVDPATGVVTLLAPGETTIEAKAEENDEYYAGSVSYLLTVLSDDVVYTDECTSDDCGFSSLYADGSFNPWSIDSKYGLKASAYKDKTCNASDAVMASPVIDLTDRENCTLSFEHALNQFNLNGTALATVDGALEYVSVVAREDGATEWTKLSNPLLPEKFSWDFVKSGDIDLSAFDGKNVQIGFRYISTADIAGTWEIKNVLVKGAKTGGVGIVDSIIDENAPVEYYNLQGVRIANPEKGQLVIVRKGNKSFKAIL